MYWWDQTDQFCWMIIYHHYASFFLCLNFMLTVTTQENVAIMSAVIDLSLVTSSDQIDYSIVQFMINSIIIGISILYKKNNFINIYFCIQWMQ